ncbi:MAG: DUF86 domain-containing protein [Candidatus Eisenbacteria bacterium]|nr:DUF86 domain-containing protein [Candidatus Eisenbacteria bacterium]
MSRRPTKILLEDMFERVTRIQRSVAGLDHEAFIRSDTVVDAVIRNLTVIGEAANRLPQDFKASHLTVPWHRIIGMRNRIVHDYFDVDLELVWTIVNAELPEFASQLSRIQESGQVIETQDGETEGQETS